MTTILMIALAVVLLLVAVGSLVSYLRETKKYKILLKKVLTFTQFCTKGVVNRHYPWFLTTAFP